MVMLKTLMMIQIKNKIEMYKIKFLLFIVSLIVLIGCGQERDIQQLEVEPQVGPIVNIELVSTENVDQHKSEELRGLTFNIKEDNAWGVTLPRLSHDEPSVLVHCYIRSTDASQPITYAPLQWKRIKDTDGHYTDKLKYHGVVKMASGTDLSRGEWFITGVIGNADASGEIVADPHYFVNLSEKLTQGRIELDIPFSFPWMALSVGGTEDRPSLGSVVVTFKPMGTMIRFTIQNKGNDSYRVRGFDFETTELNMPVSINPADKASPMPVAGVYPEVETTRAGYRGQYGLSVNPNFDLLGGEKSDTYLFWTLGKPKISSAKYPIKIYMRSERINEFGQNFQRRTLIEVTQKGYYDGYRYSLSCNVFDVGYTMLRHLMESNLKGDLTSASLSFHPGSNDYVRFSDFYSTDGVYNQERGWPIAPNSDGYSIQRLDNLQTYLRAMSVNDWLSVLPAQHIEWSEPIDDYRPLEYTSFGLANIPWGYGSSLGLQTYYFSRGDGVLYLTRDSRGAFVFGVTYLPTAFRYEFIDNPDGPGKALMIMARPLETSNDMETASDEAWWFNEPSRNTVRILPAMGYIDPSGAHAGGNEELYILTQGDWRHAAFYATSQYIGMAPQEDMSSFSFSPVLWHVVNN